MKAIVWTKYGGPEGLELREVEVPAPKNNEVLIRVHATTVTAGDCEMRSLKFAPWLSVPLRLYNGLSKPGRITILGQELAGEVEAVGKAVKRFREGDPVFGATGFSLGAYAEYICLPEESEDSVLAIKPANIGFEEAAAVPTGGLEALHFLRKASLQGGEKVLINGAGGSIGTFGIQLAKHWRAGVTGVDSGGKLEMMRSIGADKVIDYTQEDFTKGGERYDVVFDVIGKAPYSGSIRALRENGRYLVANPRASLMVRGWLTSRSSSKKVIFELAKRRPEDLVFLKELIEAGKLEVVIDRRYALEETAEAHRYAETGKKRGNVVIFVISDK